MRGFPPRTQVRNTTVSETRASSKRRALAQALLLATALPAGGFAQVTPARLDSLAARLDAAEATIAVLREQVAGQAQEAVKTASGLHATISGQVLMNTFRNTGRVNNADVPQFVQPALTAGPPSHSLGMAIRQTMLGVSVTAPSVLGAAFAGHANVDLYGGQQPSSGGRTFPLVRIRTAGGTLTWAHTEVLFGQEAPLTSQTNPISVASVGTPGFAAAGNLWLWLPQVRLSAETGGRVRVGVQAAVLAPTSGDPATAFDTDPDVAERSLEPYVQGRARVRWGDEGASEIGVGIHHGRLAPTATGRVTSRAYTADARIRLTRHLEFRAEAFVGQAVRGLGGGGVGQNIGVAGAALETKGGWAQAIIRPNPTWELAAGCGRDDPEDAQVLVGGRLRNQVCSGAITARPAGPLLVGLEYRQMQTAYAAGAADNHHVNLAVGFGF